MVVLAESLHIHMERGHILDIGENLDFVKVLKVNKLLPTVPGPSVCMQGRALLLWHWHLSHKGTGHPAIYKGRLLSHFTSWAQCHLGVSADSWLNLGLWIVPSRLVHTEPKARMGSADPQEEWTAHCSAESTPGLSSEASGPFWLRWISRKRWQPDSFQGYWEVLLAGIIAYLSCKPGLPAHGLLTVWWNLWIPSRGRF